MIRKLTGYIFLMLLSPLYGAIAGFRTKNRSLQKWTLIVFVTLVGSLLELVPGNDGYDHMMNVYYHYVDLNVGDFLHELFRIVTFQINRHTNDDVYIHVLSWVLGYVLAMPGIFFPLVSFIYAYFFVSSLFKVFEVFPTLKRARPTYFLFGLIFILWIGLDGIHTVRTWTGLWVLFYATISYYQSRKWKYALLMFSAPLFHIGFFAMALPAWGVLLIGNQRKFYAVVFFLSLFSTLLNPASVTTAISTSEVGAKKVEGYYQEEAKDSEAILEQYQKASWHKRFYKLGFQDIGNTAIILIFVLTGFYTKSMTYVEGAIFSTGMMTKALANFSWFLFALQNRGNILAGVFILAGLMLVWQRIYRYPSVQGVTRINTYLGLSLSFYVFFFIFKIANLFQWLSVLIFGLPVLKLIDSELNLTIRKAIGLLFDL